MAPGRSFVQWSPKLLMTKSRELKIQFKQTLVTIIIIVKVKLSIGL